MRHAKLIGVLTAASLAGLLLLAGPAQANSPWWHLTSGSRPTVLPSEPEAKGEVILTAANLGDADAGGKATPATIADTLPAGLKALSIKGIAGGPGIPERGPVKCPTAEEVKKGASLACTYEGTLPPYDMIEVRIGVEVQPGAHSGEENEFGVSGGGAPAAAIARPLAFGEEPAPFGLEDNELSFEEAGGAPATGAGSHPFQVTNTLTLNQLNQTAAAIPAALVKDAHVELPPGQLGNPAPFPRCTLVQFLTITPETDHENECAPQTALGVAMITINLKNAVGEDSSITTFTVPVFNLEPSFGEPARFGFSLTFTPVLLETSLRSGGPGETEPDYGVTVSSDNVSQSAALLSSQVTFWGTPGDPRHDSARGWGCLAAARGLKSPFPCTAHDEPRPPALLTLPTSCAGAPLLSDTVIDSWLQPHNPLTFPTSQPLPTLDGCNQLPFAPAIAAEPTSNAATSPTGLSFDLNVNDEGLTNANGTAQSQIRKAVVTLPEGFTSNPSVAAGLAACSEAAYEHSTVEVGSGCPEESKIGDVEVESPLVTQKLHGSLYVAQQGDNPFHNLLTLYMVIRNPELGVLIKAAGEVKPDPVTGQLTTTFDKLPQLPFSHFHLSFRQGQRSPLITPPACGPYTVKADLYPYSNPTEPVHEESSFQITQGPEGNPCPSGNTPPFHPNLEAGTINNAAGSYSPFNVRMTRHDSEQEITHFSIKLPPGVIGKLAGIPYCPQSGIDQAKAREHEGGGGEEEASPSCPAASEVGHTLVGAGVGNVLAYAPGKIYLAGPYHGSLLSIVSITAAKVGPFDLGTVVVRFALRINPETAEVFVDATGSDPIPHIVDGIPVHLRDIQAFVDRPEFVLNPTSCAKTSTASTVLGSGLNFASEADDQPVTVSSPFQVGSCASLGFKPKLALSLKGGTKRGAHPAFKAVLNARPGDANIAFSQVTLPHSEFLENAHIKTICTRVQFKEGSVPGEKCPAGSIYGHAKATTPILDEPLQGPVYLRSSEHKLPDLVAALHNSQVNIALDGRIDSVKGRIRNTFEAVPDAPVTKFTLEMQGGNKGLLVNSTDLCAAKHHAIAAFTGHNGKVDDFRPVLAAKCAKHGKKGKHHGKRGAAR